MIIKYYNALTMRELFMHLDMLYFGIKNIGMTIVPEEGWTWDEGRLNEYLDEQKKWGQVMVITNGWTYK